jgi:hypothetical protein
MTMTPENKKIWTDALRSGEYKQGVGYLQKNNCYCCLGVAAVVLNPDGVTGAMRRPGEELLSTSFLDRIGLTDDQQILLTDLNDNAEIRCAIGTRTMTFSEIADYIEYAL